MPTGSSNCIMLVKIVGSTLSIYKLLLLSFFPILHHAKTVKKSRGSGPRTPVTHRVASLNSPPVSGTFEAPTTELLKTAGTFSLSLFEVGANNCIPSGNLMRWEAGDPLG